MPDEIITVEYWPHTGTWRILVAGVAVGYWPTADEAETRARQARRALAEASTSKSYNINCEPSHSATNNLCAVSGCDEPRTGRSPWCKKHDMRVRRHGDPEIVMVRSRAERVAPRTTAAIDALTIAEAAERCGISARRVQDLVYAGRLVAQKFGKVWFIERASVEHYAATPRKAGRPRKKAKTEDCDASIR